MVETVTVDGERFEVRRWAGTYHLTWLTGPNPGYGFSIGSNTGADLDARFLEAEIRGFLAQIDPETGHL
ncbi:hypothetical protein EXU48_17140 [Occultella glacieicola]|uniref:Uncharacterized protein n=1 Tax=Occultella glacieicola TaxID=2518684 RepID=A0ABY2E088_9MICO|nr:hypothetical protein [Occultella glacieicola]TDE90832.1 hypothetical protein EXU48_17140 [Occultella glacieicola]